MEFARYYTVAEVNAMIPQLKLQMEHLLQLKKTHRFKKEELQELRVAMINSSTPAVSVNGDPFFALECELEFLEMQVRQMLTHYGEQCIMVKSIDAGLVDFPALIDGEVVLLCWLRDEPFVTHYHGLNDGFWGRRKLNEE